VRHAFEHVFQIGVGLEVVELCRGEKRGDNGPTICAAGASCRFQENNDRVPMPYLLATPETGGPSRQVSSTMRLLSASLRLRGLPEPPDRVAGMSLPAEAESSECADRAPGRYPARWCWFGSEFRNSRQT
jgi:hypothetical protein